MFFGVNIMLKQEADCELVKVSLLKNSYNVGQVRCLNKHGLHNYETKKKKNKKFLVECASSLYYKFFFMRLIVLFFLRKQCWSLQLLESAKKKKNK